MADGASGLGALLQGLTGGFQAGTQIANARTLNDLRKKQIELDKQKQGMEDAKTLGDIATHWNENPAMAKLRYNAYAKNMGLTDDQIKSNVDLFNAAGDEGLKRIAEGFHSFGVMNPTRDQLVAVQIAPMEKRFEMMNQISKMSAQRDMATLGDIMAPAGGAAATGGMPAPAAPAPAGTQPAAAGQPGAPLAPQAPAAVQASLPPGTSPHLVQLASAESSMDPSARNPITGAAGVMQFQNNTWNDIMQRHPDLGLTPGGYMDPTQATKAASAYRERDITPALKQSLGRDPTELEKSMGHVFGPTGGANVAKTIQDAPETPMSEVVPPGVIAANRGLLVNPDTGKARTAGEFAQEFQKRYAPPEGGATAPAGAGGASATATAALPATASAQPGSPAAAAPSAALPSAGAGAPAGALPSIQNIKDRGGSVTPQAEQALAKSNAISRRIEENSRIAARYPAGSGGADSVLAQNKELRAEQDRLSSKAWATVPTPGGLPGETQNVNLITGEVKSLAPGHEVWTPVTPDERAAYAAQGNILEDTKSYLKNTKGEIKPVDQTTAESERERAAATSNQKYLDKSREQASNAGEAMRMNEVSRRLIDRAPSGPFAGTETFARELMNEFGFKGDQDRVKAGETVESQFAKSFLTKGHALPGSMSDRDAGRIATAGPTMMRTPEGNKLIMDISDWSSKILKQENDQAEAWNNLRPLSRPDPKTGKNFYQTIAAQNTTLPPELEERLKKVESDAPDPKLIKGWNFPISVATKDQMKTLVANRALLTPERRERLAQRADELGLTAEELGLR